MPFMGRASRPPGGAILQEPAQQRQGAPVSTAPLSTLSMHGGPPGQAFLNAVLLIAQSINAQTQQVQANPVKSYVFARLPTSPPIGQTAVVTDSNTVVWGASIAGGGTNKVLGWWNGTAWTVVGK